MHSEVFDQGLPPDHLSSKLKCVWISDLAPAATIMVAVLVIFTSVRHSSSHTVRMSSIRYIRRAARSALEEVALLSAYNDSIILLSGV